MIGVVFLMVVYFGINQLILNAYAKTRKNFSKGKMNLLYLYHLVFFGIYLWYAYNNPSDSHHYYDYLSFHIGDWFSTFGTDTKFINFLSYPFYHMGFSYEMLMLTFAWLGYIGFIYTYLFFRDNIPLNVTVFKNIDLLSLLLFLPNMHFWTASLGKGAPIFLGLMMFAYAVVKPKKRLFLLVLAGLIIFYIRPHVFFFVAVGMALGYLSGNENVSFGKKMFIFGATIVILVLSQDKILAVVNLQGSENVIEDFQDFSESRSEDLSASGSGVDMSSYPLPFKLFTFWFRPLFIDAPNILGIFTSFENLIYLLLFFKILKKDFIRFLKKSPSYVKMSFIIFLLTSFAMTFIMSNLGIIMRQKSMVMYFLFFIIYYYLAQKKYTRIMRIRRIKLLKERKSKEKELVSA
ncbi:MAG TPA: hypothetical protein VFM70_04055 [Salinimicrobium sp.]|nr:hypothetical protein [Salinimicrobium sp.]